jgi:hypothetical protein
VGTAAAIVVNRETFVHEALGPIRSGVFAGKLLPVEVVALMGAVTKGLVLDPPHRQREYAGGASILVPS